MSDDAAAMAFARLVAEFREESGSLPTLGEFLEILAEARAQLRLRAKVRTNQRHAGPPSVRVAALNDAVFLEASELLALVAHDESLLSLFPAEPEIYHSPALSFPGTTIGEFGSAETANGALREITREETEAVGLLDGTYRQVHLSDDGPGLIEE